VAKDYIYQDGKVIVKVYPELPHPQAALLQDWIDGLDIQYRDENGEWIDMPRALDYFPNDFRANPNASHETRIAELFEWRVGDE